MRRETTKGHGGQRTGRDQEQAAMELRFSPPINCQREGDGEGDDVKERDDENGGKVIRANAYLSPKVKMPFSRATVLETRVNQPESAGRS